MVVASMLLFHGTCGESNFTQYDVEQLYKSKTEIPEGEMRISLTLVLSGSLLLFTGRVNGQSQHANASKEKKIIFHITSVNRNDDPSACYFQGCQATKVKLKDM